MLKKNNAQIPLLKTLLILLITTIIIITYLIALNQTQTIYINDKKLRTQIIESKILTDCFSNEFGTFEKTKFNQNTLNTCFNQNLNNINVKIIFDGQELYIGDKENFQNKMQFCSDSKSNLLCTKLKYPIVYKKTETDYEQKILTLLIIVQ